MSIKLRELIRSVRSCKTAAEERAVISRECALIRTAVAESNEKFRFRNVAKLLYIHMLGYPTHFGQMECVKLIAMAGFPEKRMGYLALMLILNEDTEVLMLVTNSMQQDLSSSNPFIVGLSMAALGNLGNAEMARDLVMDVDKHLSSSNPYLRKKACVTMIHIFKRVPELVDDFVDHLMDVMKDRNHGVLVSGAQLLIEVLRLAPHLQETLSRLTPSLVRLLRSLVTTGYNPEHDVSGISDPFLQVFLNFFLLFSPFYVSF